MSAATDRRRRQNRRRERQRLQAEERRLQSKGETTYEPVFGPATTSVPCQDCLDRAMQGVDTLRYLHRPRRISFPLLPRAVLQSLGYDPGSPDHVNCETCGGAGSIPTLPTPDPYDTRGRESRMSADSLKLWRLRRISSSR